MKVFISWSGDLSKRLAEALREWLPSVLQMVRPYFTPSDIEKGSRWATEIGKELELSQIGILCITRDNLHSDWVMFEAGALSKSLDKTHVCPILFGISNTDLAGPLKQFQTTEFNKTDVHKLLTLINNRLSENKLHQKTLDTVFEKWWPDLENKIHEIQTSVISSSEPIRSEREILEEVLTLSRQISKKTSLPTNISKGAVRELLVQFIDLHNMQVSRVGGYQEALDGMQSMRRSIAHIAERFRGSYEDMDELITTFLNLDYTADSEAIINEDDIPF